MIPVAWSARPPLTYCGNCFDASSHALSYMGKMIRAVHFKVKPRLAFATPFGDIGMTDVDHLAVLSFAAEGY
jgi:hypothetical protein